MAYLLFVAVCAEHCQASMLEVWRFKGRAGGVVLGLAAVGPGVGGRQALGLLVGARQLRR